MIDTPASWGGRPAVENVSPNGRPSWYDEPLVYMSEIEPIEPKFVEYPLLQAAMFHLVAGRPDIGKGALCARWIAHCTNGQMYGEPKRALWLSSEEDTARDLRPRLDVAEADLTKVALVPDRFQLPRDIDWLRERIEREGDVGLVVIDPISNHITHTNSSVEEEVRGALQPLSRLAGDLDIPMLGIRHVSTKEGKGNFLGRILGATGWVGVVRAVLGVAKDYDGTVHVHTLKGNRVPRSDSGRRFRLVGASYNGWDMSVVRAVEDGESRLDLDELITMSTRQAINSNSEEARWAILRILRENGGIVSSAKLDAAVAEETGITARTARDLRSDPHDRGWITYFPDDTGERRVWMVSLTNAAPWPERDEMASTLEDLHTHPSELLENSARARVPDAQLGSTPEQGDLLTSDDVPQERTEPDAQLAEPDAQLPEAPDTQLPEEVAQCPTCGSTKVGFLSGRCHDCGERVKESSV